MAVIPFTNGRLYVAGVNLSGRANSGTLEITAKELDASSISDAWDVFVLGGKHIKLDASGFWEAGPGLPDDLYALLGVGNQTVTVLPDGADGGVGYSARAVPVHHNIEGQANELVKFDLSASGTSRAIRGTVMHDDSTARIATGNGVARQLGALTSTQSMYGALHVISASGTLPTLDVTVRSSAASGMTSPTTRLTFPQATTLGAGWQSLGPGAVTDTWWQVQYAIGGTLPSFKFAVLLAVV